MKITSWNGAVKSALIQAFLSVIFCIVYTYLIMIFTGGEEFVGKHPTYEVVNGIRFDMVLIICGMLASLIPIILLRYGKADFLLLYIPLSMIFYFFIMFLCVLFVIDDNFDLISYALSSVPAGSFFGTIIAILINRHCNKNK